MAKPLRYFLVLIAVLVLTTACDFSRATAEPDASEDVVDYEGPLEGEAIEDVIRQNGNEIRACYIQELDRDPDLEGKITVSFLIDGTGQVADAEIGETTMNDTVVEECIMLNVRRWRFPAPGDGGEIRVNYPFTFVSE